MRMYYAPGKRDARIAATPQTRATGDRLFATCCRALVLYCMPGGDPRPERMTQAMMDYHARKHAALKAYHFRQRFGRDYWTGTPRRARSAAIRARREADA